MHINETGGDRARIGFDPGRQAPRSARVSDTGAPDFAAAFKAAGIDASVHVAEPIPAAVWTDIDRASQLADALAERGQAVRFSMNESTGKVVAGLYDSTGRQLQPIALTDLIPDPRSTNGQNGTSI